MAKKLNSMRILEANDIPYETLEYDSRIKDAQQVAEAIGLPEFMVYKTLIVQSVATDLPMITMLASDRELNLKQMAKAARQKKIKMAKYSDAEQLTGLQVGGISPLMLMDKNWPVYVDSPATELQHIIISAGQRGTQIQLPVQRLINLLQATIASLSTG